MTKTYTYTEARQNLSTVLEQAVQDGEVRIIRRKGLVFVIKPETTSRSPLDVPGVDINISADEIVSIIREGREQRYSY